MQRRHRTSACPIRPFCPKDREVGAGWGFWGTLVRRARAGHLFWRKCPQPTLYQVLAETSPLWWTLTR